MSDNQNSTLKALSIGIHEEKNEDVYTNLYNSEKYLKTIIDSSLNGIAVVDDKGIFEFCNDSYIKIIEWPKEEIIGHHFIKIIPEDTQIFAMDHWNAVFTDHGGHHEFKIITKLEIIKHLNVSTSLVDIDGKNKIVVIVHDITEKKRLEQELRESEGRYKDLFENANESMYIHDLKGNILSINEIGAQMLGGTKEDVIGTNIAVWLKPECFKIFEDRVRKIFLNQPLEQPVVMEVINKNGEHRFGAFTTRLIRNGEKIIGVHGIARDITERIRLEKQLKESEEKYRELFENSEDAMYVMDDKYNFLKMNMSGIKALGCTKEEVIGTNISKWATPESLKIINERRRKRILGEKLNPEAIEVVCKNGEHRWIEIRTRQIINSDKTVEIHGIAKDITENRLLKQELNKSNRNQRLLCHLIQNTRGGETRALILKLLSERSYNANQLATALKMDYKTIRHHLDKLMKNGIIGKSNDGYSDIYFISNFTDLSPFCFDK